MCALQKRSQSVQKQLCIAATELEGLKKQQQQQVNNHTHENAQACSPVVEPVLHVNQTPAVIEVNPGMIINTDIACQHTWSFDCYLRHTVSRQAAT